MADEVLDSWEDMLDDDNGLLVRKLEDIRVTDTNQDMRSTARPVVIAGSNTLNKSGITGPTDGSDWSPIVGNNKVNDNCNPIKILKRPTIAQPMSSGANEETKCQNDSNQNQNNVCPQITLEDNTRTQYVPQVRILKRPDAKDKSAANDKSNNANRGQTGNKTYEEREAEYAKARLRIMGSAVAPEEPATNQASGANSGVRSSAQTSNSCDTSPKRSPERQPTNGIDTNVPVIRLPFGPDGTRGFNQGLTPEQR